MTAPLSAELSDWAQWVQGNTQHALTPFQAKAVDVLCCGFGSPWNAPWGWHNVNWNFGRGISVCAHATPSTYDFDYLTRLVIAAHEECVRVEIAPAGPSYLRLILHPRERDGGPMRSHPTIDEAVASFRKRYAKEAA